MAINFRTLPDQELLYGARTCQGCGAVMAGRMALKVLGEKTFVATPACCFAATTSVFPQSALFVNNAVTAFAASAATGSGMSVAAKKLGFGDDVQIMVISGDGGTVDIGLQALSGAAERNDNIIYLCYDNEAYMNTGVQRSGSTAYNAWTTTTPVGPASKGEKTKFKKSLFEIMAAHRVPYVATTSVSHPRDFMEKMEKAKAMKGCKVIHVFAPCPTGWGHEVDLTVEMGKQAVETGLWYLAEYENDTFKLNYRPKELKDIAPYLKVQKRFAHLNDADIAEMQEIRDQEWERLKKVFRLED
ncbi:thiamine pyrophosphate-dependent enzyme [Chakrabartyella piscis]|uniref:thiamine pyrophosphate-dependent enzyme n=1 Tax=Chakrabartyella piscis TaxID=2918914 RepID=UPI002958AD8D|nr:thiamine pyrophosphate-dependent enzyme [Chakrabartyella piscis]